MVPTIHSNEGLELQRHFYCSPNSKPSFVILTEIIPLLIDGGVIGLLPQSWLEKRLGFFIFPFFIIICMCGGGAFVLGILIGLDGGERVRNHYNFDKTKLHCPRFQLSDKIQYACGNCENLHKICMDCYFKYFAFSVNI